MYNYGYYSNPFYNPQPQPYQQPQQFQPAQSYQPAQAPTQNTGDERIYVQGEVGAKAYLVAPGNTVTLWDSEQQAIYLKTVSPTGIPSMQRLNYTVDNPKTDAVPKDGKAITDRIEALETAVNAIKTKMSKMEVAHESVTDDTAV